MSTPASQNISIPSFEKKTESSFVEHITNSIYEIHFPVNKDNTPTGEYFKNHVTDFGKDTRLFMNVAATLWETSTDGVPEADHLSSMSLTSTKFIQNIDDIMKKLSEDLPGKLAPLNWRGKNLSLSFYNDKQFRGMNKKDGKALYGAPSCIFVLEMEPVPGMVAVCKPKRTFTPRDEEEDDAPPPRPKATDKYRQAAASAGASASPAPKSGGAFRGGKPAPK